MRICTFNLHSFTQTDSIKDEFEFRFCKVLVVTNVLNKVDENLFPPFLVYLKFTLTTTTTIILVKLKNEN